MSRFDVPYIIERGGALRCSACEMPFSKETETDSLSKQFAAHVKEFHSKPQKNKDSFEAAARKLPKSTKA